MKRVAVICTENIQRFPSTAIDKEGKLQLGFINQSEKMPKELSLLAGLTVIRKCCERNQIYSLDEKICMENQMLSTQYFDDRMSKEKNEIFFRIGFKLNCTFEQQTTSAEFRLVSSNLQVRMDAESDWEEQLISAENYCLEDYVESVTRPDGLPETKIKAKFCTNQTTLAAEFPLAVDPINLDNLTAIDKEIQEEMEIPKCCLPGYVVEGGTCRPLMLRDSESTVANALNQYFRKYYNISSILISNASLSCPYEKSPQSLFLLPVSWVTSLPKLKFRLQAERNVSLSLHIYKRNDWDFESQLQNFCVDIEFFRNLEKVSNAPQVFYCAPQSTFHSVSIHYPILLSISAASLLATFIIYFIVPASGNS